MKRLAPLMLGLALVASGCEVEETGSEANSTASSSQSSSKKSEKKACGTKATRDCTPHVTRDKTVRVDAMIYRVKDVRTAAALGDQEYGLGEKADGRFIIVEVEIRSDKDESATLSGDSIQLEVGGNTYDSDNEGTVAAMGAGEEPLFLEDIGPDATITSKVVFDVPTSVLDKKVEVRFNELGFGETHAYIRLPRLSSL